MIFYWYILLKAKRYGFRILSLRLRIREIYDGPKRFHAQCPNSGTVGRHIPIHLSFSSAIEIKYLFVINLLDLEVRNYQLDIRFRYFHEKFVLEILNLEMLPTVQAVILRLTMSSELGLGRNYVEQIDQPNKSFKRNGPRVLTAPCSRGSR